MKISSGLGRYPANSLKRKDAAFSVRRIPWLASSLRRSAAEFLESSPSPRPDSSALKVNGADLRPIHRSTAACSRLHAIRTGSRFPDRHVAIAFPAGPPNVIEESGAFE